MTKTLVCLFGLVLALPPVATDVAAQEEGQACEQSQEQKPAGAARIRIESADQLPRHTYPVPESATALVEDEEQFAALAEQLEADLKADLAKYEIPDAATLKEYYRTLASLALIEGQYDAALAWTDCVRAIENKPALKALTGTFERALAVAAQAPGDRRASAFEEAYRAEIAALTYEDVEDKLKSLKRVAEMRSPGTMLGFVRLRVQPAARSGEISRHFADPIVEAKLYLDVVRPVQEAMSAVLGETIAAHVVDKPDIWPARAVSLEGRADLTPVVVAIWDTGTDVALYEGRLFVNEGEVPDNGADDDGNGYADDVHGIAHDTHGARTTGALMPLNYGEEEEAAYRGHLKGFTDLEAGLDTPEATELKRLTRSLTPEEFTKFFRRSSHYRSYAHGTSVAGVAVAGNPAARILVARVQRSAGRWDPEPPNVKRAQARARAVREKVAYFRDHGVRVVNMSWGFSSRGPEGALERRNAGGTPAERRALGRRLFDIRAGALREAISGAPEILFVTAAGNADEDNRFSESVPASFDLPNLITVGAVDQAGDEAAFTSYGRAHVYGNGVEVESYLPGGETILRSGTSLAAPQVANLAAKLWAAYPDLTVAEVRRAIVDAADEKAIDEGGGDRVIRLLNPKASFSWVEEHGLGR